MKVLGKRIHTDIISVQFFSKIMCSNFFRKLKKINYGDFFPRIEGKCSEGKNSAQMVREFLKMSKNMYIYAI